MTDTHIKMPDVEPVIRYTANGVDTIYLYHFPIFASEDIAVMIDSVVQISGYMVTGSGETNGGTVVFDTPPATGKTITIERRVPYERLTDFLEAGDFSARAINNELDYLVASLQQLARDQKAMLRYAVGENPAVNDLPLRAARANKALGFDNNGNPIPIDYGLTVTTPNFTASGIGAVPRSLNAKVADRISVRDFGGVGDGVADDTAAFGQALAAHDCVFVPKGIYRITTPIVIGDHKILQGCGVGSVIKANAQTHDVLQLNGAQSRVDCLAIDGGYHAIKMEGTATHNQCSNLSIDNAVTAIHVQGHKNTIRHIIIHDAQNTGIKLSTGLGGEKPSGNFLHDVMIDCENITGAAHGIHIISGDHYNIFSACQMTMNTDVASCITVDADADETALHHVTCKTNGTVPNLVLAAGSQNTVIQNLHAQSGGAAIDDQSGGSYQAFNAGYPTANKTNVMQVNDLTATLLRQDTVFLEHASSANLPLNTARSVHLVSAYNGAITIDLPAPSSLPAATYTIKKIDQTGHPVIVKGATDLQSPDRKDMILGGPYDYVTILSNGAEWFVTSSNRMAGNTQYLDVSGQIDIDLGVDTYLISAYSGAVTCRLPPANAAKSIGRTITIKKTDVSANAVTIIEQGGGGADQSTQYLSARYDSITILSNGAEWYIVNRYP